MFHTLIFCIDTNFMLGLSAEIKFEVIVVLTIFVSCVQILNLHLEQLISLKILVGLDK